MNPESTDQIECKENGDVVSGWLSCNLDESCGNHDLIVANCQARCEKGEFGNVNPPKNPAATPAHVKLLANLSFSSLKTCETKLEAVNAAADFIQASGSTDRIPNPDAYCKTLYPLGVQQDLALKAALSVTYTFTDIDDCVTKTVATKKEADSVKIVAADKSLTDLGDAVKYCEGLFPGATTQLTDTSGGGGGSGPEKCDLAFVDAMIGPETSRQCSVLLDISTHAATAAECVSFCNQSGHGPGYCNYESGLQQKNCWWASPETMASCGPVVKYSLSAGSGFMAGTCNGAPVPLPVR